jgi:glutathione S-transferase
VPPRPDLTALTGGYRRAPILQIGADIYCDTAIMVEALERLAPANSVYPTGSRARVVVDTLSQWGDSNLFWTCIAYFYQTGGVAEALSTKTPEQIESYFSGPRCPDRDPHHEQPAETHATLIYLQRLEKLLESGHGFLLGDLPTLADFSCYHPLWCLRSVRRRRGSWKLPHGCSAGWIASRRSAMAATAICQRPMHWKLPVRPRLRSLTARPATSRH